MSRARIFARSAEASNQLAKKLRARGFEIEARPIGASSNQPADVEFSVQEYSVEDALERAAREAGPVFITPGALVDDLRPIAIIPLIPERVALFSAPPEAIVTPSILPNLAEEAPLVQPIAEMPDQAVEVYAPTLSEDSHEMEPFVGASDMSIVDDLAAQPASGEHDSANRFVPEFAVEPVIPELSGDQPLPSLAINLEEPTRVAEIPPEVSLQNAESLPINTAAEPPESASLQILAISGVSAEAVPESAPIVQPSVPLEAERRPEPAMRLGIPTLVPPIARRTPPKIRIVLPAFKKSVHVWVTAAVLFAVASLAVLLISMRTAPQAGRVQPPEPQTSPQVQKISQTANKTVRLNPAPNVSSHRPARASDNGYIAKDTVVRYGNRGAASGKKPLAQSGSTSNRSPRE